MALILAARRAVAVAQAPVQTTITRAMSMAGVKGFDEHGKAVEDMYFTKEDQVRLGLLEGLL